MDAYDTLYDPYDTDGMYDGTNDFAAPARAVEAVVSAAGGGGDLAPGDDYELYGEFDASFEPPSSEATDNNTMGGTATGGAGGEASAAAPSVMVSGGGAPPPPSVPSSAAAARDYNAEFQALLEDDVMEVGTSDGKLEWVRRVHQLWCDFEAAARQAAAAVVREHHLPVARKTVKPVMVGGVAGGEKFLSNGIFLKRVVDTETAIYGGDEGAMKAAGHELHGLAAFFDSAAALRRSRHDPLGAEPVEGRRVGPPALRIAPAVLVDYRGWRVLCTAVLPVGGASLCYGSDDQARTVHCDPSVQVHMQAWGRLRNLKEHMVGRDAPTAIVGPCDIEVHRGRDGRLYVLDTARVYPPATPDTAELHGLLIPSNPKMTMVEVDLPPAGWREAVSSAMNVALEDEPLTGPRQRVESLPWAVIRLPQGGAVGYTPMICCRPATGGEALHGLRVNVRASELARRRVVGPAVWFTSTRGEHLFKLLRPETVSRSPVPLSSDAFTGFGMRDAVTHNGEVRQATTVLLEKTIPEFAEDITQIHNMPSNGRDLRVRMKAAGINMRYLGHVQDALWRETEGTSFSDVNDRRRVVRQILYVEMVARTVKNQIRYSLRGINDLDDRRHRQIVVHYLNAILGNGKEADAFWRVHVIVAMRAKFGKVITGYHAKSTTGSKGISAADWKDLEGRDAYLRDLRVNISMPALVQSLQSGLGIVITVSATLRVQQWRFGDSNEIFTLDDIVSLTPEVSRAVCDHDVLLDSVRDIVGRHDPEAEGGSLSLERARMFHNCVCEVFGPDSEESASSAAELAVFEKHAGNIKNAVESVEHVAEVVSASGVFQDDVTVGIHYALGCLHEDHGDLKSAVEEFQLALRDARVLYGEAISLAVVADGEEGVTLTDGLMSSSYKKVGSDRFILVVIDKLMHLHGLMGNRATAFDLAREAHAELQTFGVPDDDAACVAVFGLPVPLVLCLPLFTFDYMGTIPDGAETTTIGESFEVPVELVSLARERRTSFALSVGAGALGAHSTEAIAMTAKLWEAPTARFDLSRLSSLVLQRDRRKLVARSPLSQQRPSLPESSRLTAAELVATHPHLRRLPCRRCLADGKAEEAALSCDHGLQWASWPIGTYTVAFQLAEMGGASGRTQDLRLRGHVLIGVDNDEFGLAAATSFLKTPAKFSVRLEKSAVETDIWKADGAHVVSATKEAVTVGDSVLLCDRWHAQHTVAAEEIARDEWLVENPSSQEGAEPPLITPVRMCRSAGSATTGTTTTDTTVSSWSEPLQVEFDEGVETIGLARGTRTVPCVYREGTTTVGGTRNQVSVWNSFEVPGEVTAFRAHIHMTSPAVDSTTTNFVVMVGILTPKDTVAMLKAAIAQQQAVGDSATAGAAAGIIHSRSLRSSENEKMAKLRRWLDEIDPSGALRKVERGRIEPMRLDVSEGFDTELFSEYKDRLAANPSLLQDDAKEEETSSEIATQNSSSGKSDEEKTPEELVQEVLEAYRRKFASSGMPPASVDAAMAGLRGSITAATPKVALIAMRNGISS